MSEELKPGAAPGELSAGRPDREILMESATVRPNGDGCGECRVRRGMPAISTDGEEVGWIAGIVVDGAGTSTGLIVARPQTTLEYYHLPLGLVNRVDGGQVMLGIPAQAARSLPRRNAGSTP